jgi:hypothetical protein
LSDVSKQALSSEANLDSELKRFSCRVFVEGVVIVGKRWYSAAPPRSVKQEGGIYA